MEKEAPARDHLFISYATEDAHFAEWLTLKLTAEGYKVWCDRFKLLGGEPYPQDIDTAIKNKTFRVIALLSNHSIKKDNPVKERTLAMNLGKEREETDFLIPLNIGGLKPTEMDWMLNNLTYIPFHSNWADGLKRLLKKLNEINAPRLLQKGRNIASQTFLNDLSGNIEVAFETLHSNIFQFTKIPSFVYKIKLSQPYEWYELRRLLDIWPHRYVNQVTLLSFQHPPEEVMSDLAINKIEQINWQESSEIESIPTKNLIKELLLKSLETKGIELGLKRDQKRRLYFPKGLFESNNLLYKDYSGKNTFTAYIGFRNRTHPGREYDYHLSPRFTIREGESDNFFLQLGVQLYLTNKDGAPLRGKTILRRRKNLCKNWWNSQWFSKHAAISHFLSEGSDEILIGQESSTQIKLSNSVLKFQSPVRIVEQQLAEDKLEEVEND
ncbi:hypothetical protein COU60_03585 [Candidatus Pacearchaeota archaeon CG10_big_fil_rev_8_21_14_0_10_34_76]|nr:MAG: hypothetical protein COU60_03585 [Candidatus Pacearchaeota archaeon CG10_big_fil_rev_8_21_14_0_10_34_76]